jgi:hypothetical protein
VQPTSAKETNHADATDKPLRESRAGRAAFAFWWVILDSLAVGQCAGLATCEAILATHGNKRR